jgi:hypothetical protein
MNRQNVEEGNNPKNEQHKLLFASGELSFYHAGVRLPPCQSCFISPGGEGMGSSKVSALFKI